MMVIGIQTIRDGKIAKTYHMENWLSVLGRERGPEKLTQAPNRILLPHKRAVAHAVLL